METRVGEKLEFSSSSHPHTAELSGTCAVPDTEFGASLEVPLSVTTTTQ